MSKNSHETKMTRRDLLKMMGLGAGAGLVDTVRAPLRRVGRTASWLEAVSADPQAEFEGMLYRGSVDGCIYASSDGGASWGLFVRLHDQCAITDLKASKCCLTATLEFEGYPFSLTSTDGKVWMSA